MFASRVRELHNARIAGHDTILESVTASGCWRYAYHPSSWQRSKVTLFTRPCRFTDTFMRRAGPRRAADTKLSMASRRVSALRFTRHDQAVVLLAHLTDKERFVLGKQRRAFSPPSPKCL